MLKVSNEKGETFNDVLIEPQYSETERSSIDISTDMGKFKLKIPLISANMKDITGPNMVVEMAKHGGLGILHRFGTVKQSLEDFNLATSLISKEFSDNKYNHEPYCGVSVGVKELERERFKELYNCGAKIFTVDVAHGYHLFVREMIDYMREIAGDGICIIAGNIATPKAVEDLMWWGADIVKVGIGSGGRCVTRKNTGVGVPQLKAIRDIRNNFDHSYGELYIISDGGIRLSGDITKALKYSNAVMVGSYIAGTSETPNHVYEDDSGKFYKIYGGSASGERKVENGNKNDFVEGVVSKVEFRGHAKHILRKTSDCIKSAMSYSGSTSLREFRGKCKLIDIGSGGKAESRL